MEVRVGDITARCPDCGGEQFDPAGELRRERDLVCKRCGKQTPRETLLEQIGDEAIRQAEDSFARLKKDAGP
jgi:hypothetical protein